MSLFSKDTSFMEKVSLLFPVALIAFMYASAFGVFHNFYSVAVAAAKPHALWFTLGFIFTASWIYTTYKATVNGVTRGSFAPVVLIGIGIVLSLLSFCGFAYPYVF